MAISWFKDGVANRFYQEIKIALDEWTQRQLPQHELSHIGIKEPDFDTGNDEVIIRLHFNKIGKVKIKTELHSYEPPIGISGKGE